MNRCAVHTGRGRGIWTYATGEGLNYRIVAEVFWGEGSCVVVLYPVAVLNPPPRTADVTVVLQSSIHRANMVAIEHATVTWGLVFADDARSPTG